MVRGTKKINRAHKNGSETVAYRGGLEGSNLPPPPKFRSWAKFRDPWKINP
jgi:hypothetical protein